MRAIFDNHLSDAEIERLALLAEEMGEALHAIGKILRHGYDSVDPTVRTNKQIDNRSMLEQELGDVRAAIVLLCNAEDVSNAMIQNRSVEKLEAVRKWLHHQ